MTQPSHTERGTTRGYRWDVHVDACDRVVSWTVYHFAHGRCCYLEPGDYHSPQEREAVAARSGKRTRLDDWPCDQQTAARLARLRIMQSIRRMTKKLECF